MIRAHIFRLAILILIVIRISGQHEEEIGSIVQGRQALPKEFPFVCSLQDRFGKVQCGGIILTINTVLTACHCIGNFFAKRLKLFSTKYVLVEAGSKDLKGNRGQIREAGYLLYHEKCKKASHGWRHDYGIVNLLRPFVFADNVKPIRVYSKNAKVVRTEVLRLQRSRTKCIAVGWGTQTIMSGIYTNLSSRLKAIETTMIPDEECIKLYCKYDKGACARLNLYGQFCALGVNGSDVCTGDSGGPVICNGFVFGITSWGIACGEIKVPSVFSSIEFAFDFSLPRLNEDSSRISNSRPPYIIAPYFYVALVAICHFYFITGTH